MRRDGSSFRTSVTTPDVIQGWGFPFSWLPDVSPFLWALLRLGAAARGEYHNRAPHEWDLLCSYPYFETDSSEMEGMVVAMPNLKFLHLVNTVVY